MNNLGILQGRLTPSLGRGVQFYPQGEGEWEKEFILAKELGISHLEWAWEKPWNPLLGQEFRKKVRSQIKQTGVFVIAVDLQFLTKNPIEEVGEDVFTKICEAMTDIGAQFIEIPLLEDSTLLNDKRPVREQRLGVFCEIAKKFGLGVNLETDLPPEEYKKTLAQLPDISVLYDSGNSAHFAYTVEQEWDAYARRIAHVHIKDRLAGGGTVALGTGDANIKTLFKKMKEVSYTGPITLQAARGADGEEVKTIQGYIKFIKDIYESI